MPIADTLKRADDTDGTIVETSSPRLACTGHRAPGGLPAGFVLPAPTRIRIGVAGSATDDAMLVEALGHPCHVVDGSPMNLKITTAADLRLASAILRSLPPSKPDAPAHPFADERAMWGDMPREDAGDLFSLIPKAAPPSVRLGSM